jgi:UDP-N-acetylmuramate dehydrogenase
MKIEIPALIKILSEFKSIDQYFDVDISKLSTMRLKSIGHYIIINQEDEIPHIIQALCENKINYKMIGWGANQILKNDARDTLYVKLKPPENPNEFIKEELESYLLPASLGLNTLVSKAIQLGFKGWEVLTGIPASLGGACYMNAGTKYGDIASIINRVYIVDEHGKQKIISTDNKSFSYRKNNFLKEREVITKIEIFHHGIDKKNIPQKINEYMEYRKMTQPLKSNNCGCIFKNMDNQSAGKIIQDLGLKGLQVGGMRVSQLHANFLENAGNATYEDFWNLVARIQDKVEEKFGKKFELEINY